MYNPGSLAFMNGVALSTYLGQANPLTAADTAAGATGYVYIDINVTLTVNTVLSAKWIGAGGVITLGVFDLTGNFWAPDNIKMFNVNSTGRVIGPSSGGGDVNAYWFGALDGTDISTPLKAAIRFARRNVDGTKNRRVTLNSGTYTISSQIIAYDGVSIQGQGANTTTIIVAGTFSGLTTTGAMRIGDGSGQVYGTRISDICLDLNNITGAVGFYTSDAQDGTGFEHTQVKNVTTGVGIWINGNGSGPGFCNNYILNDGYVSKFNASNGGTAYRIDGGTLPAQIQNLTVVATGGGKFTYGYYFENAAISARSLSVDGSSVLTGVYISTGNLFTDIQGLTILGSNPTGVSIAAQNPPVHITSYFYIGGGNMIVDGGGGTTAAKTISGNGSLPVYARGQKFWINATVNLVALQSSDPSIVGDLWGNTNVVTRSA